MVAAGRRRSRSCPSCALPAGWCCRACARRLRSPRWRRPAGGAGASSLRGPRRRRGDGCRWARSSPRRVAAPRPVRKPGARSAARLLARGAARRLRAAADERRRRVRAAARRTLVPSFDQPVARGVRVLRSSSSFGGALLFTAAAPPRPAPRPARHRLSRVEWALPLGALVALLGAFVAMQFATLFGGERHVLETARPHLRAVRALGVRAAARGGRAHARRRRRCAPLGA